MVNVDSELLKRILMTTGVITDEDERASVIMAILEEMGISYKIDDAKNILVGNTADPTIVLAAHVDEVGVMITNVGADGVLGFKTMGYIHPHTLLNSMLKIKKWSGA